MSACSSEDLVSFGGIPTTKICRTGKWTPEEEAYAKKMINLYCNGLLILEPSDGRTLRTYLARKLDCNPMRISKKFSCFDGLGVRYHQREMNPENLAAHQQMLKPFEEAYHQKELSSQSRRFGKKQFIPFDVDGVKDKESLSILLKSEDAKAEMEDLYQSVQSERLEQSS
eukprot:CAMPEP_0182432490 /NCGR_PEP_ID=MMETSP1167-20130531/56803_1 /TAXON_ID=2988 /ORGANISM="Mallomonas Sp, Strain CCMP3275" /LENGTH=169 /DNA_ID=CAMNT_0024620075 /DNA_START=1 /DNA_END=506 /DNA_ORIENTATION=+